MGKVAKRASLTLAIVGALCLLGFLSVCLACEPHFCRVDRVVDGDTIVCGGKRVRLIGIDTPESQPNRRAHLQARRLGDLETVLELGKKAKEFVSLLLPPGTRVELEFDVQKFDKYGRLLAYVWLPDGRMLNEVLLEEGYAVLYTVPPNVKYVERLRAAQRRAVEEGKGLWGTEQ